MQTPNKNMILVPEGMHLELVLVAGEVADEHRSWPVMPKDEDAPYVYQLLVRDGTDLEDAMRDAAVEYLRSEAGRGKYYGKNDDGMAELDGEDYEPFGPKEFWRDVPDDVLERHGLRRLGDDAGAPVHGFCTDGPVAKYADAWEDYLSEYERRLDGED